MTWFRIDDGFYDHSKVHALQEHKGWQSALALWTLAGVWCSRHLSDGAISRATVHRLGFAPTDADLLVRVGLWELEENGYRFHDWAEHNPTRADVQAKREKTRRKVTDWRAQRAVTGPEPPRNPVTGEVTTQPGNPPVTTAVTLPPARPGPARSIKEDPARTPDALRAEIAKLQEPYPADLVDETRDACGLHRNSGRIADSVWLRTLQALAKSPTDAVVRAMRIYVEKCGDGSKGERYLLGIVRGEAKRGPRQQRFGTAPEPEALTPEQTRLVKLDRDIDLAEQAGDWPTIDRLKADREALIREAQARKRETA